MDKKEFIRQSRMIFRFFPGDKPPRGVLVGSSVSECWLEAYCGIKILPDMHEVCVPDIFAPTVSTSTADIAVDHATENPVERFRRVPVYVWDEAEKRPRKIGYSAWTRYG